MDSQSQTKRQRIETRSRKPKLENQDPSPPPRSTLIEHGPFTMQKAYLGRSSHQSLITTITHLSLQLENTDLGFIQQDSFDKGSMLLKRENVVRVMPGRILHLKFFPFMDRSIIIAGNKSGDLVFWNADHKQGDDGDGIYLYRPYHAPISGISIKPNSFSKVFTGCYDGYIRMLDFEKESFDFIHYTKSTIYSLSQQQQDPDLLYFGAQGFLNVLDTRAGKLSSSHQLHENSRINTIDFNQVNTNLMATSSIDETARIWDLRQMNSDCLKTFQHESAVQSAYFSPNGNSLATTSLDNQVGIFSGIGFENVSMISHTNHHNVRGLSTFRAIWGWDDTSLFIGNMNKEVDVIHTDGGMSHLRSSDITAIPCRFAAHPHKVGTLAAATSGGQIYLWTQK